MKWLAIPGGEVTLALERAENAGPRLTLTARLDLQAPGSGGFLCRPASAAATPAPSAPAPPLASPRLVVRGDRPVTLALFNDGQQQITASFVPRQGALELPCAELRGDSRLIVGGAGSQDRPRVLQLPGLVPWTRVGFGEGAGEEVQLSAACLDLDLASGALSLFWTGGVALPRGASSLGEDEIRLEARFVPAAPVARFAVDRAPAPRSPACAPPIDKSSRLCATVFPWQLRPPHDAFIVVVKGTFDLVEGEPARLADEQEEPSGEQRHPGGKSLSYPGDFAPHKPRADVLLNGHAHGKPGATVAHVELRVGAIRASLAAIGPRRWGPGGHPGEPAALDRVPLRYEHAFGGPDFPANPVGTGHQPGSALPALERSDRLLRKRGEAPPPAGFGALDPAWEARARKVGSYGGAWRDTRWPFLPEDFDLGYWNAAPAELTGDFLRGDEAYRLSSVLPGGGDLAGELPGIRPRCFVETPGSAELDEVPLSLDTVVFDSDRRKLVLVWRGAFEPLPEARNTCRFAILEEPTGAALPLAEVRRWIAARAERPPAAPAPGAGPTLRAEIQAALGERRPLPGSALPGALARSAALAVRALRRPSRAEVERWIARGERLAGRDLAGADLSGIDLSGQDLSGTILRGAILDDARLDGAIGAGLRASELRAHRSSWKGARLTGADFARARLDHADLSSAILEQASFADAELRALNAQGAQARAAQFLRASLPGGRFDGAQLEKADFSHASMDEARFPGASLDDARFYGVLARGLVADRASLGDARFEGASLDKASFREARAQGSTWEGASLVSADFTSADLRASLFTGATLRRARFAGADLAGARFRCASLEGASFTRANLVRASFEEASAASADFSGANLYQAETLRMDLSGARLTGALVKGTKLA